LSELRGGEKLAYMANQIARYFAAQPGEAAAEATRDHLKSFWTPAMRRAIVAHASAGPGELSVVAARAVALLAEADAATPAARRASP
jgi:formate dehydrogenase subunit delta